MRHSPITGIPHTLRIAIGVAVLLGFSLSVAACDLPLLGSDDDPASTETSTPSPDGAERSDAADHPLEGDPLRAPDDAPGQADQVGELASAPHATIVEGAVQEPRTLNPILVADPLSEEISRLVFSGLTTVDPDDGEPAPDLATHWEIDEDGTSYTFYLHDDILWHDGQPFTAQDVVFTFDLMMDERTRSPRYSRIVERVVAVEATGSHTVQFRLPAPYAPFLSTIATFGIVPQHLLSDVLPDELVTDPFGISSAVGTGPFSLNHWGRGDRILFDAYPDHHEAVPAYDLYEYRLVPDENHLIEGLEHGSIDWARISPENIDAASEIDGVRTESIESYEMLSVVLQQDSGRTELFDDPDVRTALMLSLDREAAIADIWHGHARVAHGTIPPASWAFQEPETRYAYDPARANELLTDAGWVMSDEGIRMRDGMPFQFSIVANGDNPIRRALAEWLAESWREVGADVRPSYETWGSVRERVTTSRDFETLLLGYRWDVDPNQHSMWASDSIPDALNLGSYVNLDVDDLLAQALTTRDTDERDDLYARMQEIVVQDLPVLPLAFPNQTIALGPRLQDVDLTAILLRNRAGVATWVPNERDESDDAAR